MTLAEYRGRLFAELLQTDRFTLERGKLLDEIRSVDIVRESISREHTREFEDIGRAYTFEYVPPEWPDDFYKDYTWL